MEPVTNHSEVEGAGGVVFDNRGRVLVLEHRNGTWVFPKGHLDPGETALEAALREVEEEAGVTATLLVTATQTTRYTNGRGEHRLITWFLMTTTATEPVLREATFLHGAFLTPDEARAKLNYPEDKTLLDAMLLQYQKSTGKR